VHSDGRASTSIVLEFSSDLDFASDIRGSHSPIANGKKKKKLENHSSQAVRLLYALQGSVPIVLAIFRLQNWLHPSNSLFESQPHFIIEQQSIISFFLIVTNISVQHFSCMRMPVLLKPSIGCKARSVSKIKQKRLILTSVYNASPS
jgi:hypothetical protein